jgi:hypothetical protein
MLLAAFSLVSSPISSCLSSWKPICIRGVVRQVSSLQGVVENRMSHQRGYWILLSFSPCSRASLPLLSFSSSWWSEESSTVRSYLLDSCFLWSPVFQDEVLISWAWQSSLTLVDFLTLADFLTSRSSRLFMVL